MKWNNKKNNKKVPMRKTGIQYLESRIHGVKSRIEDCLGIPLTGRNKWTGNSVHFQWQFSFTSSARVSHVVSHVSMFFFWTKPSWLWFFIFNLLDNHGASNPGYSTVQTIRNWDVAKERLLLSFILSKGYKVKFLKSFAKNRMYLMRSWRNTLDWKLSHQKIRRRLL